MEFNFRLSLKHGEADPLVFVIDEPIGFKEIVLEVWRDSEKHGVFFDTDLSELTFVGIAATQIMDFYTSYYDGMLMTGLFEFDIICNGVLEETYVSQLDFSRMNWTCGVNCMVVVPVEKKSCYKIIQNRMDTPVDVDDGFVLDTEGVPPDISAARFEMELLARDLYLKDYAETSAAAAAINEDLRAQPDWFDNVAGSPPTMLAWMFPALDNMTDAGMGVFNPSSYNALFNGGFNNRPDPDTMPPTVLFTQQDTEINCEYTDIIAELSIQADVAMTSGEAGASVSVLLKVFTLAPGLDETDAGNYDAVLSVNLGTLSGTSDTMTVNEFHILPLSGIVEGSRLWFGFFLLAGGSVSGESVDTFTWQTNEGSYFKLDGIITCDPSLVEVTMIHELLNRVSHIISGECQVGVRSDYYGRTDSVFYPTAADGCGSLRILTNGLKLRRAPENNQFISMQEAFDGLNAIDCIGMGIEADPLDPTAEVLRIEPDFYFYDYDSVAATFEKVTAETRIDIEKVYSVVSIGYSKWETEFSSGLDEFNSTRKWSTAFRNVKKEKVLLSNFIAGSYPTELMRRGSFALTGAADNTYDNDHFIICVERDGGGFIPEYNISEVNTEGILPSVTTVINGRISPIRMLARWYHSLIIGSVKQPNVVAAFPKTGALVFAEGTGNYKCTVWTNDETGDCTVLRHGGFSPALSRQENQEDGNFIFDFSDIEQDLIGDYTYQYILPLHRSERITFETPMTYAQYRQIKSAPYGQVLFSCGDDPQTSQFNGFYTEAVGYRAGFISSIKYRLTEGMADVELIGAYARSYTL